MPLVFYVNHSGDMYEADTPLGDSVMNGAVANMIDGILGECGCIQGVVTRWSNRIFALIINVLNKTLTSFDYP